jgi:hypothetical protein
MRRSRVVPRVLPLLVRLLRSWREARDAHETIGAMPFTIVAEAWASSARLVRGVAAWRACGMTLGDRADVLDGEPATCRACGELLQIWPIDDRRHAGSDTGQQPARTIIGR